MISLRWVGVATLCIVLSSSLAHAQQGEKSKPAELDRKLEEHRALCNDIWTGELSAQLENAMTEIEKGIPQPIQNVFKNLQEKGFKSVFRNSDVVNLHNPDFKNPLPSGAVTNQEGIGFCWDHAGLGAAATFGITRNRLPKNAELSQLFTGKYHLEQQAEHYMLWKLFMEEKTGLGNLDRDANQFRPAQGGTYQGFAQLYKQYGTVPYSVMPATSAIINPGPMMAELNLVMSDFTETALRARQAGADAKKLNDLFVQYLVQVRVTLTKYFGTTPTTFEIPAKDLNKEWVKKHHPGKKSVKFTPRTYAKYIGYDPNDYVVVGSYALQPFHRYYNFPAAFDRAHTSYYDTQFLNLPNHRLIELAKLTLAKRHAVWMAADVSNDFDPATGIIHPKIFDQSILGAFDPSLVAKKVSRRDRSYFGIRNAEHAMLFLDEKDVPGMDGQITDNMFLTENSWGQDTGRKGFYFFYASAAPQDLFEVVVLKSLLNAREKKLLKAEPTILYPDQPF